RTLGGARAARTANVARWCPNDQAVAGLADALRHRLRRLEGRLRRKDRKLFASQASDDVRVPALDAQQVGKASEHGVADVVAEGVVDALEEIEIEQQHGERTVVPLKA